MGCIICLFCITFIQVAFGQITTNAGQNALNAGQVKLPFAGTNTRGFSTLSKDVANGLPAVNHFARNVINNGNNVANAANSFVNARANAASVNQAKANFIQQSNLGNPNSNPTVINTLENTNVAITSTKLGDSNTNLAAQNYANNLAGAKAASLGANNANLGFSGPNLSNHINGNFARPNKANQMYPPASSANQIFRNASPYYAQNAYPTYRNGLFGMANPNLASGPTGNLASGWGANGNTASVAAAASPGFNANGFNFAIDGNPFTVIGGSGSQPFDLRVVADALQISGTLSIAGKMPIYGTVSLNGNLPTEGVARVNYSCTSQRNV